MAPKLTTANIAPLCPVDVYPLRIESALLVVLQNHFSSTDNMESAETTIRSKVWTADLTTTAIIIESNTKWNPRATEHRPQLVVKANKQAKVPVGIDDRMMGGQTTNKEYYETFWQGSHTVMCCAGTAAETRILATEVHRQLGQFGHYIRSTLDLLRFKVLDCDAPKELNQEGHQNFAVPVSVAYMYSEKYEVTTSKPAITGATLTFN